MKVNVLCGFQSADGFTYLQYIVTTYRAVYENEQKTPLKSNKQNKPQKGAVFGCS